MCQTYQSLMVVTPEDLLYQLNKFCLSLKLKMYLKLDFQLGNLKIHNLDFDEMYLMPCELAGVDDTHSLLSK